MNPSQLLKPIIDKLFAALESKLASHPLQLAAIQWLQAQVDAALSSGSLDTMLLDELKALLGKIGIPLPAGL